MYIYMISYDLHSPTNNREKVEGSIKSLGTWSRNYAKTVYGFTFFLSALSFN